MRRWTSPEIGAEDPLALALLKIRHPGWEFRRRWLWYGRRITSGRIERARSPEELSDKIHAFEQRALW